MSTFEQKSQIRDQNVKTFYHKHLPKNLTYKKFRTGMKKNDKKWLSKIFTQT